MFISMEAITQEISIKVLDKGNFGKIKIALSKEKEKDKEMQKSESWIYQGVTGESVLIIYKYNKKIDFLQLGEFDLIVDI